VLDGTAAVRSRIMPAFAGGSDNASIVKFIYNNLRKAPDAATLAALVAPWTRTR